MNKHLFCSLAVLLSVSGLAVAGPVINPVILEGNYIRTTIGQAGTLGDGYQPTPGLQYDASGTGNFNGGDFLTPGSPWDYFMLKADQTAGVTGNNNDPAVGIRDFRPMLLEEVSGLTGFDNHVRWIGASESARLTNEYFFNDDDQHIQVLTTITAYSRLDNLRFARSIDPDQDADSYGEDETLNGRGYDANHDGDYSDPGDAAPRNWTHSQGAQSGLVLGLFSDSPYAHDTGVSSGWEIDPDFFLAANDDGDGDHTLGLAFSLGDLLRDESISFTYSYVLAANLSTAGLPAEEEIQSRSVPEPDTLALLSLGVVGLGAFARRRARYNK